MTTLSLDTLIHNSNMRYQHYSTADWALGRITDRPQTTAGITLTITTPCDLCRFSGWLIHAISSCCSMK